MPQMQAWDKEYKNSKLLHFHPEPQKDTLRFLKYLKKEQKWRPDGKMVLDMGCGTGRNANHIADMGGIVTGFDISPTAISIARDAAKEKKVDVTYYVMDMGKELMFPNNSFDLLLDVTSSNSLNETERALYLTEAHRILKPGGFLFVKALAKDGDDNAKALLQKSPGKEKDTYIMKELNLTERVFTRDDIMKTYEPYFTILSLEKKESYTSMNGRSYKRQSFLLYLQKK